MPEAACKPPTTPWPTPTLKALQQLFAYAWDTPSSFGRSVSALEEVRSSLGPNGKGASRPNLDYSVPMSIRPSKMPAEHRPFKTWEFFAGGGLAGLGLADQGFEISWANDIDPAKGRSFARNHPAIRLNIQDIWNLGPDDLPGNADLAWASSPCQDLSLAGNRRGLASDRSGAFWGFWKLIQQTRGQGRGPRALVLENVPGLLSSGGGRDFQAICQAMVSAGFHVGALQIDTEGWLPQSRPRLFVVALDATLEAPHSPTPVDAWHSPRLRQAQAALAPNLQEAWRWWTVPLPPPRSRTVEAVLQGDEEVQWLAPERTRQLLTHLAPAHRDRLEMDGPGRRVVALGYIRIRREQGRKIQRLELRTDGLAGCLRTPAGGSSRQYVLVAEGTSVRARYLTAREAARLMGVPDSYHLPASQSAGLKLMGDAVAVPVVRALAQGLLVPALQATDAIRSPQAA